jgi:RimJ/RimL family protein N-acetyltransferase
MSSTADFSIEPLDDAIFDDFADYLRDPAPVRAAAADADADTGSDADAGVKTDLPSPQAELFRHAIHITPGAPGWRRVWVLRSADGFIAGHADLRGHPAPAAAHRCLIGVSVNLPYRRRGWGARLMARAEQWLIDDSALEWVDLQVLSVNDAAFRLYLASGYAKVGEIAEMFKVDGEYFSFISMSKKLHRLAL